MGGLTPMVDITSINGVESLFRHGVRDPWGLRLAAKFADFIIYSDVVRFTMPVSTGAVLPFNDPVLPKSLDLVTIPRQQSLRASFVRS